jgi:hypothetical protein
MVPETYSSKIEMFSFIRLKTTFKMTDIETHVLKNGLLIEDIAMELRSETICINALKWGLKTTTIKDHNLRREICFRILKSFPFDILISGFVRGHLSHFS